MNEPMIIAYRGITAYAPENTLPAFAVTLELGFGVEWDLRVSRDDRFFILHDAKLDRTTSGHTAWQRSWLSKRCEWWTQDPGFTRSLPT